MLLVEKSELILTAGIVFISNITVSKILIVRQLIVSLAREVSLRAILTLRKALLIR